MVATAMNTRKIELNWPIRCMHDLPDLKDIGNLYFLEIWLGPKVVFNSSGIRDWIRWLQPLSSQRSSVTIQLFQCPESFVQLINMISNFVPTNAEIMSFYIPFYSENTRETKRALLTKGHEYLEDKIALPEVLDSEGQKMEVDVEVPKFFRFLKNR
jgi:hypothetical protein